MREFSPIFTERATNIVDAKFKQAMQEVSAKLKELYHAHTAILLPGSGTFAMEAVTRQYAAGKWCHIVRNGYFSYRWEQILEQGRIASHITMQKAVRNIQSAEKLFLSYTPPSVETVITDLEKNCAEIVFATHVETSTGIQLPESYIKEVAEKAHQHNALLVMDSIASGCSWLNMQELGIDILVTAPQKGFSAQAGCGIVLLSQQAEQRLQKTSSSSYSMDLKQWLSVMQAYESGEFKYHATLPTEAILSLHQGVQDLFEFGTEKAKQNQQELGTAVRALLEQKDFFSVAAFGYQASSVLVYYATDPKAVVQSFQKQEVRIGGSLPFILEEESANTFRIGLLGIEKMKKKEEVVALLEGVLRKLA